jgi:ADP-ribosylation factor-binding protein GGA
MINNVMAKFADVKKGLYDTQYEISGKQPTQNNTTEEPRQAISLIDLDDAPTNTGSNSPAATTSSALNDLSDIFGTSANTSTPPSSSSQPFQFQQQEPQQQTSTSDIFDLLGQSAPPKPVANNNFGGIASPSLHNTSTPPPPSQQQARQSPSPPVYNNNNSQTETGTCLLIKFSRYCTLANIIVS